MALSNPNPSTGSASIPVDTVLTWSDSVSADYWRVYFGTSQASVQNEEASVYRGNVYSRQYDPRTLLAYSTGYYWKIVSVVSGVGTPSAVWSFTTAASTAEIVPSKGHFKLLCAIAGGKFYYEDSSVSPREMKELTTLTDLDEDQRVSMEEIDRKIFIANGTVKKVVDFRNHKITGAFSGDPRPTYGMILAVSGGASMIVDYWDGATTIYGYKTTAASFANLDVTTGENADGETVTFTLNAAGLAPTPAHVYNWRPFGYSYYANPADNPNGQMPPIATQVKRYKDRACLIGNTQDPHQYYQARQGNPYDWRYAADDESSPYAGGNSHAGKVGDPIVSQIPFRDDYMVYGGTSSMWLLRGNAASGGSMDELTRETGIVSPEAYCLGPNNELYWMGINGIYKMTADFAITCLTKDKIPQFAKELGLNPTIHEITMAWDKRRDGIMVRVTSIYDGSSSGYWYDFRTGGFYPEDYPDVCGAFSQFYYDADSPGMRRLMLGCKDGYIRFHDDNYKSDDVGLNNGEQAFEAIVSYAVMGPFNMSANFGYENVIKNIKLLLAGGLANGTQPDTGPVDWAVYTGQSAEELLEHFDVDWDDAVKTYPQYGTVSSQGASAVLPCRMRGAFGLIVIGNNSIHTTWAMERVYAEIEQGGKARI
ncbi:MAG TPA: hypothetical protein PKB02_02360 [Anaerohalosphaeraceae bacterium]|nr:hypothetical protein [Anaerohalosphaeraceae bacterium]